MLILSKKMPEMSKNNRFKAYQAIIKMLGNPNFNKDDLKKEEVNGDNNDGIIVESSLLNNHMINLVNYLFTSFNDYMTYISPNEIKQKQLTFWLNIDTSDYFYCNFWSTGSYIEGFINCIMYSRHIML
jgi:hypothetical protein